MPPHFSWAANMFSLASLAEVSEFKLKDECRTFNVIIGITYSVGYSLGTSLAALRQ